MAKRKPTRRNKKEVAASISRPDFQRAKFLLALESGLSVKAACLAANMSKSTAYYWREKDEEFAAAWDIAIDDGTDCLEDEAVRRAKDGTEKPVFHAGKQVGTIREYSDTLLIFLLKGRRPDKFKDRTAAEHLGKDGKDLPAQVQIYLPDNGRNTTPGGTAGKVPIEPS